MESLLLFLSFLICNEKNSLKTTRNFELNLEHKFKHSFQDTLNPFCDCSYEIKATAHFLLYYPQFSNERSTLLNKIKSIDISMLTLKCQPHKMGLAYKGLSQSDSNLTKALFLEILAIIQQPTHW